VAAASARHRLVRRSWDQIGTAKGHLVHIDGVHLNDRSGEIVTELLQQWITEAAHPQSTTDPAAS
jgi:hypothetical protein